MAPRLRPVYMSQVSASCTSFLPRIRTRRVIDNDGALTKEMQFVDQHSITRPFPPLASSSHKTSNTGRPCSSLGGHRAGQPSGCPEPPSLLAARTQPTRPKYEKRLISPFRPSPRYRYTPNQTIRGYPSNRCPFASIVFAGPTCEKQSEPRIAATRYSAPDNIHTSNVCPPSPAMMVSQNYCPEAPKVHRSQLSKPWLGNGFRLTERWPGS